MKKDLERLQTLFLNAIDILEQEFMNKYDNPEERYNVLMSSLGCDEEELEKYAGIIYKEGKIDYIIPSLKSKKFTFPIEYTKATVFPINNTEILSSIDAIKNYVEESVGKEVLFIKHIFIPKVTGWKIINDVSEINTNNLTVLLKIMYVVKDEISLKADSLEEAILFLKDNYKNEFDKVDRFREPDTEVLANFWCNSHWDIDFLIKLMENSLDLNSF